MGIRSITLYELNSLVKCAIDVTMTDSYWVEAELAQVQENGGHCYMELIQNDERRHTTVARARATCWRSKWQMLRPHFERVTGQRLHAGMKVLLQVHATFHENYGFSWNVEDIDPTYTMGDMARKRQEIIDKLKAEGVFELQKELSLPMFCQHVAVISSATAAGYGDFCHQLDDNEYGLQFDTTLFPAIMQGEQVEESVIAALDAIMVDEAEYDCVVIIRGGGSTTDLSGFDTLALAENVANYPLPVITGIGHDRDESVLDMVSFQRVKTPTAAAAFLVDHLARVYTMVMDAQDGIVDYVSHRMEVEKMRLQQLAGKIPGLFGVVKTRQMASLDDKLRVMTMQISRHMENCAHHLDVLEKALAPAATSKLMAEKHRLEMLGQRMTVLDPQQMLKRGYSITLFEGKTIRDATKLKKGDEIETRLASGVVKSRVE